MPLIVEDGTGKPDANSYGSVADADAYFADRGNGQWAALTTGVKEGSLVQATDYIDAYYGDRFIGTKSTIEQALEWPRVDAEGYDEFTIPSDLKKATYEYSYRASKGPLMPDPVYGASGFQTVTTMEKVGEIQREYAQAGGSSGSTLFRPYPAADILLKNLLEPYAGGNRVIR